jgi:Tfp pilus assembly protein PilO
VTTDSSKETIPYKVTARGTFHQIVSFINRLERDDRYLAISDLDIKEEQAGVSEATFTLSTFRFLKSSEAPQTAQAGQSS